MDDGLQSFPFPADEQASGAAAAVKGEAVQLLYKAERELAIHRLHRRLAEGLADGIS